MTSFWAYVTLLWSHLNFINFPLSFNSVLCFSISWIFSLSTTDLCLFRDRLSVQALSVVVDPCSLKHGNELVNLQKQRFQLQKHFSICLQRFNSLNEHNFFLDFSDTPLISLKTNHIPCIFNLKINFIARNKANLCWMRKEPEHPV